MLAKFDSYRRFEEPSLYVCSPGCIYRDGMLTNTSGVLTDISDLEIIPTFNATSQLNFRCYRVKRDNTEESEHYVKLYNSLRNRRLIYADGIGFFVITSVEDGYEKGLTFKDIAAESCEVELRSKGMPYIEDGTYKFYTGENGNPGIIERMLMSAPLWSLGEIDYAIEQKYRTFEDVDFTKNILGFMLEDLQDAYECIFVFDIINRIVNVYDQANYVRETSIHITKNDFINSLNITESSDDLYTALSVTGDEELSINAVNPIGTNVIYNFDYYLDWMTDELREKVQTWQDLVRSYADEYYNLQLSRYSDLASISSLNAERDRIDTQLSMYKKCRENIVAESSDEDIVAYNSVIASVGGIEIPEDQGYLWVMYADDNRGLNMTTDPYGKNYIGLAWDKPTNVASLDAADYSWFSFRSGESFSRRVDGSTKYTWVVFADSTISGMSNNPDDKAYIGVSLDNSSSTKSSNYGDYIWSLVDRGGIGITEVLSTIITMIDNAQSEYDQQSSQIETINTSIESKIQRISEINSAVSMQEYFTDAEMDELSNYIIEGSYSDEYVTVTDQMSYIEVFQQMKTLYDRAVLQLDKVSSPTQEFTIDVENFIFVKEFEQWSDQLETGCLINVEIEEGDVAPLFLTSFAVNYQDRKLTMTFGNRYDRFDPKALFDKFLGNINKTANTLSYIRDTIYPIKNGEFNSMKEALESSRTLTKNSVLASENEQVVIDDTGYTGRKLLPDGTIDPKQIKINGRNIVFTDDAWETCRTAIGEIILGDGRSAYGINAEIIMGNMIYGNQLHIIDKYGNDMFAVTEDNIVARIGEDYASKDETISMVDVYYCRANSETICSPSTITVDWSTSAPGWAEGEYIWQKTVTEYADGTTEESDPVCISGASGQDGNGIMSTEIRYSISQNGVTHPNDSATWSATIPAYNEGDYIWCRTRITYTDQSSSTSYSVSRDGVNGNHNAIVYLYRRSTTAPTIDWTNSLTYNFSTHKLNTVPSNWSETIPSGVNTLYMTAASASANTTEDTIAYTEWSTPVALSQNGINTAAIFLYQRATSASALTKPNSILTYTFSNGRLTGTLGGWSQNIPANNGKPCFVIQATASSVNETDTIAVSEWSDITELVSDGVGISDTAISYCTSQNGSTPPSSGWGANIPQTIAEGEYLWTKTVTTYTDGTDSTVYSVSRNGTQGQTGRGILSITNKYAVSTSSSVVPSAWRDDVPTLTAVNKYLWNYEIINYDDSTTETTEKRIIGVYGDDGQTGNGISAITEYYLASASGAGVTTETTGWTTTIQTVTAEDCYLWNYETVSYTNGTSFESQPVIIGTFSNGIVSSSVQYATSTSGTTAPTSGWGNSVPIVSEGRFLWTKSVIEYSDGTDSTSYSVSRNPINGNHTAIVYLFKRSTINVGVNWTDTLTYNFTNNSLNAAPNGWYQSIPDGTDPIYMTAATASSNTNTDTIAYTEWSAPIKIAENGINGTDGMNSATVFLYQRAVSGSSLTKPSGTLTYTFASGTLTGSLGSWSQTIPAVNGNPCFVIQATAVSTAETDNIAASEWSEIREFVTDGEDGVGIASAVVSYAKGTDGANAPSSGWSSTIPSNIGEGEYLWTRTVTTYSDDNTSTSYSVSRNAVNGTNGKHTAVVYLYKRSSSSASVNWTTTLTYNFTTNALNSVPSGWSRSIPSGTDPIYMTAATASSNTDTDTIAYTEWAAPILIAQNGQDGGAGANGMNSATVFLYQRSSDPNSLSKPSGNLTYRFSTGALTGTLGNWSQRIPATDGTPCYVIQATAISTGETDTISPSEWSEIIEFVADGEGIGIESATVTYAVSTSGDVPPSEGWSDVFPGTVSEGNYLWTRTITIYTDGNESIAYSVSASGVGIESIVEEYYLSSSSTTLANGAWSTDPPSWVSGYYIWTRSHIYWTNGNESTTTPIVNKTLNELNTAIGAINTEIEINKEGIQQNTEYYNDLYGKVSKINAYIQTGVLSYDDNGKATYGVKIGENLSSMDAYIVSGASTFSVGWLSETAGGVALTPLESVIYTIKTNGSYYGKSYKWNGSAYEEANSDGTLSSIFTSSELGFYDTGEKTAYFSNKNLNVRTVRTNKILLSTDVISDTSTNNWQIGIDNGFYLKWIGS